MFRSARTLFSFLGIAGALVCYALIVYYPALPKTIVGWLSLFFVGIPLLFLFEWIGEKTLGSPFFSRLSSAARVALGVPVFILVMVVVIWLASNAASLIAQ